MIHEPFLTADSPVHRMDPRVKLVAAFAISVTLAVAQRPTVLLAGLGFSVGLALVARLAAGPLLRRLAVLNIFIVLIWLMLPFTTPGHELWRVGGLVASAQGISLATAISLKSNAIFLALTALLATTTVFNLAHALDHLRVPGKLVQLFFFTWRYIHEAARELARLRRAMRVRCFAPRTDLHTYRSYGNLIGTLLVRSFDRSQRVYDAMVLRGYSGFIPAYRHPHLRPADIAAALGFFAVVIFLGVLEWT